MLLNIFLFLALKAFCSVSETVCPIVVEGIMRNISVKLL